MCEAVREGFVPNLCWRRRARADTERTDRSQAENVVGMEKNKTHKGDAGQLCRQRRPSETTKCMMRGTGMGQKSFHLGFLEGDGGAGRKRPAWRQDGTEDRLIRLGSRLPSQAVLLNLELGLELGLRPCCCCRVVDHGPAVVALWSARGLGEPRVAAPARRDRHGL